MTEASARTDSQETGILVRGLRAFELLFSAHARVAKLEARADLARILSGLILAVSALGLLAVALLLGHAAAVLAVERRYQWGFPASIGAIAGADVVLALLLFVMARARLSTPVLAETRAMMKKAASVVRG